MITRAERALWIDGDARYVGPRDVAQLMKALDAADALRGALVSIRRQYPEHVQLQAFIDSEIAAYDAIVEPPSA